MSPATDKKEVPYALIKALPGIYKFIYNVTIKDFWVQATLKRYIQTHSWTYENIYTPIKQVAL